MKKAIALVLSIVLVLAALPLMASARNLNDDEKAIFEELRTPTQVADGAFALPEETIVKGENYLAGLDYELTKEQTQEILSYIADAKAAVRKENTGVTSKWSRATKDRILDDVDKAAQVVKLNARAEVVESEVPATTTITGDGSTTTFTVAKGSTITEVLVNGVATTSFSYNAETGELVFLSAPLSTDTVKVTYTTPSTSRTGAIQIYSPTSGQVIVEQDHLIKTTGSDFRALAIVGACGLIALCACAFVSKKVELF